MIFWQNLKHAPPDSDCEVCVKVGLNYETYRFMRYSSDSWRLYKFPRYIEPSCIPDDALYINLELIK